MPAEVAILADAEAVAGEACRRIGLAASEAIAARGVFRLVLAGGTTPTRCYQLLASTTQDWPAWEIFWGDERCLPVDHPERNSRSAGEAWLSRVPLDPVRMHVIPAELGPTEAARRYAALIAGRRPFDLVLLGLGEDGHTASLFPGRDAGDDLVVAVHDAPKPPAERVSLGVPALRDCRRQMLLATGAGKAAALAAWRRGEDLPVGRVLRPDAWVLVDASLRTAVCA